MAFDLLSLAMTINDIRNEGFTVMNTISLVTDVASVALPIVPAGVSHALRAAKTAAKLANTADAVGDTIKTVDKVVDTAKSVIKKADDVLGSAKKPIIIIGENMEQRVRPFAKKIGAETINDYIPGSEWTREKNIA